MPVDSTFYSTGFAGDSTFTGSNSTPPGSTPPGNNGSNTMAAPNKQNSDFTGLSYAEEDSLKVLPTVPVWRELEPNTYADTGGSISTVARTPIRRSRQRLKGSPVDIEVGVGFNQDLTQRNLTRLLQGFFFADALEKAKTQPFNGAQVAITAVATDGYSAASGMDRFKVGDIVNARSFAVGANNGPTTVTAVTASKATVGKALTAEAAPVAASHLSVVGFAFGAGDNSITVSPGIAILNTTAGDFTTLKLNVGEWVFVGGDLATSRFTNNVGYARIKSIAAKALVFDKTTWTPAQEPGAGKSIQIYFGDYLRNATVDNPDLIKIRSYNIERALGNDGTGQQGQYFEGSVANELTINIPGQDKINADLTFVSLNDAYRNGSQGLKSGSRVASLGEAAFNTSLDVYRQRMTLLDPATLNPTPLFGYFTEGTVTITNSVTVDKAVGVFGGFDVSIGDFEVGGSVTAYFSTLDAVAAIRNNADVTMDWIVAHKNSAIVYDLPLLTLGGGRLTVEKSRPILLPLDTLGAQNDAGYTLGMSFLNYVPNVGMPA